MSVGGGSVLLYGAGAGCGAATSQSPATKGEARHTPTSHSQAPLSLSPIQQELAAAGTLELELVGSSPSLGRQLGCKAAHYQPVNL